MYNTNVYSVNPFTFGNLALDDAFVDRERELEALLSDMRSGQDVLLVAPRRYGKSSLALRAVQAALQEDILVASCDLMRTPTKERFAAALAKTIHDDLASPVDQALDRAPGSSGASASARRSRSTRMPATSAFRFGRVVPERTLTTRSSTARVARPPGRRA